MNRTTLQTNISYSRDDYLVSKSIVVSEERIKGSKLHPAKTHLTGRLLMETANICSDLVT